MQLTIREATLLLNVPEGKIHRWLDEGDIPAVRVGDDVRFNRSELLEWATLKKIPLSIEVLRQPSDAGSLAEALQAGGVHDRIPAETPEALLRAVVEGLSLPIEEKRTLVEMLLSRGAEALAPLGRGIVLPHVRRPAVASVPRPVLALYFLERPLDLKAPDGRPVDTVFFLVSPTARAHLHALARLAAVLHDPDFRLLLSRRENTETILGGLRRLEGKS